MLFIFLDASTNKTYGNDILAFLFVIITIFIIVLIINWLKFAKENSISKKLLTIAAYITKIDGKVDNSELKKVNKYLHKKFSKRKANTFYNYFIKVLNTPNLSVEKEINDLNYNLLMNSGGATSYYTNTTGASGGFLNSNGMNTNGVKGNKKTHKIKWLHFLVSIAVADGVMSNIEIAELTSIAKKWEIHQRTLTSILAMFNYTNESDVDSFIYNTSNKKLINAFKILELESTATTEEIKKQYKKLIKENHPDKLTKPTSIELAQATEITQKIQNAYEDIKKSKRF